jgi:DNA modification methylase
MVISVISDSLSLVGQLFEKIDSVSCDRDSIPQDKLDITQKSRASILPWRGQFSPELIELLLTYYSPDNSVILDPFVGSGTTLFESARKGLVCYGTEINPAAIEMAKTAHFVNIDASLRANIIETADAIAQESLLPFQEDLFSYYLRQKESIQLETPVSDEQILAKILAQAKNNPLVHNILVNAVIRYQSDRRFTKITNLINALNEHTQIVKNLPYSSQKCRVFHGDARTINLPDKSIDVIITSPPYINVFNYHQNNRNTMELIGWDLLKIAKSEIGANRKNRQNRFLTVVQYALDMLDVLKEMRRLLRENGRAIIVIGRKSNIRGISIDNSRLVSAIGLGASFILENRQERKFKNKFGDIIYEDILHLKPSTALPADEDFARVVAQWILTEASHQAEGEILNEIIMAKERAKSVQKSPLFPSPNNS